MLLGGRSTFGQSGSAEKAETLGGAKVVGVRVVDEHGTVLLTSPKGLPILVGEPLDSAQVAESIRILYRTGVYARRRDPGN